MSRRVAWPMLGILCSAVLGAVLAGIVTVTNGQHRNGAGPVVARLIDTILCTFVPDGPSAGFYIEMASAHAGMDRAMEVAPSGDPDRDFARMMIPHHQGAIDMARIQLKYGRDQRLRRLAQSILVEQTQEISYLRTLLDTPPAVAGPDRITRQ